MKRLLLTTVVIAGIFLLFTSLQHTFAARGNYSTACTTSGSPNDTTWFPYGFLCGTDNDYDDPLNLIIERSNGTEVSAGGVKETVRVPNGGLTLTVKGGWYDANNHQVKRNDNYPANRMLVWTYLNTQSVTTAEAIKIIDAGGGIKSRGCPGYGSYEYDDNGDKTTRSGPGKVLGFRDVGSADYSTNPVSGTDASPAGYDPDTQKGTVNCGDSGKMVYWFVPADHRPGREAYQYKIRLPDNLDANNICVRMTVAVQFDSNEDLFPAPRPGEPPHRDQNVTASHMVKQSAIKCFNIEKPIADIGPPPTPSVASCQSAEVTADPYKPGSVTYKSRKNLTVTGVDADAGSSTTGTATSTLSDSSTKTLRFTPDNNDGGGVKASYTYEYQYRAAQGVPANGRVVDHWYPINGADGNNTYVLPSQGPCYSAKCQIYRVDGDAPNRKAKPGSTFTAHALIENDSGWLANGGTYIRDTEPNESHRLKFQSVEGSNVNFSSYVDAMSRDGGAGTPHYRYIQFTGTAPSSGASFTIKGQMRYGEADVAPANSNAFFMGTPCEGTFPLYQPPQASINGACHDRIYGWAYSPEYPSYWINVKLYVDDTEYREYNANLPGYGPDGVPGDHGYSIPVPSKYQDGRPHTYKIKALDSWGVQDGWSDSITLAGCARYTITPNVTSGSLLPDDQDPNIFRGATTVRVNYGNDWSGPSNGVPAYAIWWHSKNGANVSGDQAYPWDRFINRDYTPPDRAADKPHIAGTEYCLNLYLRHTTGFVDSNGDLIPGTSSGEATKKVCDKVVNKPFFKAYGKGIWSGGKFDSGDHVCTGGGTLASWNNNSGTNPSFGASSQLSAIALSKIVGLASARTSFDRSPAYDLSFANADLPGGHPITSSDYSPKLGGYYKGETGGSHCLTNLAPKDGTYESGNKTIGATTVAVGQNIERFINGNVYISGNISYDLAGWGINPLDDTTNVPSHKIVASGNIYIAPGVTQLDGLYISKGQIFTCGTAYAPMAKNDLYNGCNNQLVVNGSFVAQKVNFMRTYGSLRDETPGSVPKGPNRFRWSQANNPGPTEACVHVYENFDQYWGGSADPRGGLKQNQYLCSDKAVKLCFTQAYWRNAPGDVNCQPGVAIQDTTNCSNTWDVPWEPPGAYWSDNWLCSTSDVELEFFIGAANRPDPSEVNCTRITGVSDDHTSGGNANQWNDSYVCDMNYVTTGARVSAVCSNSATPRTRDTCAAEVFDFSPEFYMSKNSGTDEDDNGAIHYDAITNLPPVL